MRIKVFKEVSVFLICILLAGCANHYISVFRFSIPIPADIAGARSEVYNAVRKVCLNWGYHEVVRTKDVAIFGRSGAEVRKSRMHDLEGGDNDVMVDIAFDKNFVMVYNLTCSRPTD